MKLFIIVNVDWFFLSHRLPVAMAALKAGWDVTVVTADTGRLQEIEAAGLKAINLPMTRSGMNVFQDLKAFRFLYELYKKEKPDIAHHVAVKAILWGGLAARFAHVNGIVNAISGLGGFFAKEKLSCISKIVLKMLKFSHHRDNLLVIFQNSEDKQLYLDNHIINEDQVRIIRGSGVDLMDYSYTPEPEAEKIIILLTCRMIREKGVFVLIEAAERLRTNYSDRVEFWIAGGLDDHPGAIRKEEMELICDSNYIKWLGRRDDVKDLLKKCHIFAFPSFYREGIPKSLIEAAAIGRPIITTNNIGCKEVVMDGVNGYLVPVKDAISLAAKLKLLIDDKALRVKMGMASRTIAEQGFSLTDVIKKHLNIYKELS